MRRLFALTIIHVSFSISIHTPLTRCDAQNSNDRHSNNISIHTPLTRCDLSNTQGALLIPGNFNPHTSHEVRLNLRISRANQSNFNPHTSHEVRPNKDSVHQQAIIFQSTHLSRGATLKKSRFLFLLLRFQSTHLSRGATQKGQKIQLYHKYFNPHTSHEVRQARKQDFI